MDYYCNTNSKVFGFIFIEIPYYAQAQDPTILSMDQMRDVYLNGKLKFGLVQTNKTIVRTCKLPQIHQYAQAQEPSILSMDHSRVHQARKMFQLYTKNLILDLYLHKNRLYDSY